MKAIRSDALAPGQSMGVMVEGRNVAIFNVDGVFHALENRCAHRGGPLAEGSLDGQVVFCPWHDWQFDVTSGECVNAPGVSVQSFSVSVTDGDVLVDVTGVR